MSSSVPQNRGHSNTKKNNTKRGSNLRVGSDGYCLFDMNRPMHTAVTLGLLFVGLISTTERE